MPHLNRIGEIVALTQDEDPDSADLHIRRILTADFRDAAHFRDWCIFHWAVETGLLQDWLEDWVSWVRTSPFVWFIGCPLWSTDCLLWNFNCPASDCCCWAASCPLITTFINIVTSLANRHRHRTMPAPQ